MPGGAVPRGEVCKTGEAPARGAARSAAGGRRRRPKAGDAFRGGGTRPVPLTQNLRGGIRHFPRKTSRGTRPARPAGGGLPRFCRLSGVDPLGPAEEHLARDVDFRGSLPQTGLLYMPAQRTSA